MFASATAGMASIEREREFAADRVALAPTVGLVDDDYGERRASAQRRG
jgi:hypothetical protein